MTSLWGALHAPTYNKITISLYLYENYLSNTTLLPGFLHTQGTS